MAQPPRTRTKRKTAAEYLAQLQALALARGGLLLSRAYLGDAIMHRWRCAEGHVFLQRPTSVKQDKWCRLCGWKQAGASRRARTETRIRRIAAGRGGTLVGGIESSADTRARLRCANGHEWIARTSSIVKGTWCRKCSNEIRFAAGRARVLRRLERIAREHGGEVLATTAGPDRTRYQFQCAKNHRWEARPVSIDRGTWCQVCVRDSYLERLRKHAVERGGALLSRRYVDEDTALRYRCARGHRFEQRPADSIKGSWCAQCSRFRVAEKRKAPARARLYRIVAERGGTVQSEYVNSQTPMRFRCSGGHEWETTPNVIFRGAWCQACRRAELILHPERRAPLAREVWLDVKRRLERIVAKQGGEILPPGFTRFLSPIELRCARGHTWKTNPRGIQEGVWCRRCREESLMAAFRERAERWRGECLSESCRSGRDILQWRCAQGHRFQKSGNVVLHGSWCPRCRNMTPGDLERMKQIALERGGECLSERYLGAATKLRWRCGNGHSWSAVPGMITKGHWCPRCRYQLSYSRARLSLEMMRETAAERGGKCLSDAYNGNKVRLRWRCARGHTWMAHPNRIRQGSWCPVCSHSSRGTIDGMRALAIEYGGRCLTRTWNNHQQPLRFECARGHRFHALGATVKTGVWCPSCARPSRASVRVG